jgi:hypothetical protein
MIPSDWLSGGAADAAAASNVTPVAGSDGMGAMLAASLGQATLVSKLSAPPSWASQIRTVQNAADSDVPATVPTAGTVSEISNTLADNIICSARIREINGAEEIGDSPRYSSSRVTLRSTAQRQQKCRQTVTAPHVLGNAPNAV